MHPNPVFRRKAKADHLAFARARAFGALTLSGPDGILMAHVPFLLNAAGDTLDLHLVRSNPILRQLDTSHDALLAVMGPDGYVSPDWYGVVDQVPTWNYVAVHLRGRLETLPQESIRDMIDRQTAHFENQLTPKTPWKTAKMTPEVLDKMMRQIVPCRLTVTSVDGTWKLNQNKPDDVRNRAAEAMESSQIGQETSVLAALMRKPPQE